MRKHLQRLNAGVALFLISSTPMLAGTGRLDATRAIYNLALEFSGPLSYAIAIITIIVSAATWLSAHNDMNRIGNGLVTLFLVLGIMLFAVNLLASFFPGAAGALV